KIKERIGGNFWLDLTLRLIKTFIASFLGTVGAMQFNVLTFDWSNALNLAAIAALSALAKGFLASGADLANNPSTMRPENYTEAYSP
ncbi:MAG: holin, partial [Nocardioides sp.]